MDLLGFLATLTGILSFGYLFFQESGNFVDPRRIRKEHVISAVLIATFLVISCQSLGLFQDIELIIYDRMMRLQKAEDPDPRLTIISVNEEDIQYQIENNMRMKGSLSDEALEILLNKINKYNPRTIGLDIYHDYPFEPESLKNLVNELQNFFIICKAPSQENNGIRPAPDFPLERVGFSDFQPDKDNILRRQILAMGKPQEDTDSICKTNFSFSFLTSLDYLSQEDNINFYLSQEDDPWRINQTQLKPFEIPFGGYQRLETRESKGHQLMLNYRSLSDHREISNSIYTVKQVLEETDDETLTRWFEDQVILIGVDNIIRDNWLTTNNVRQPKNQGATSGVFIQGHMISQILSAVLDGRKLIETSPQGVNIFWTLAWSSLGGFVVFKYNNPLLIVLLGALIISFLLVVCLVSLSCGWWVLFVPPCLGFLVTGILPYMYLMLRAKGSSRQS